MSRLTGWFRSSGKPQDSGSDSDAVDGATKQKEDLADALKWTSMIMNDNMDEAEKGLAKGDSCFHDLGTATTVFMRSMLGFEKTEMMQASARLNECETRAWNDYKRAQRKGSARSAATKYPPGTEYELLRAQAQLMGAIVGVLHENLLDAVKSFYKLRRAFITLDGLVSAEARMLGEMPVTAVRASVDTGRDEQEELSPSSSDSEEFIDAKEETSQVPTPSEQTRPSTTVTTPEPGSMAAAAADVDMDTAEPATVDATDVQFDNVVDEFIHSGINMSFGLLLLILSLIPPAFSRILSVVGFRGDRARGVSMLWKSSVFPNMNGAIAGAMLLAYYNGLLGAVDILPSEQDYDEDAETVGPPKKKIERLLAQLRSRYPESRIWRIEEARLLANDRDLVKATELLKSGASSKMKQVAALNNFEMSLDAMMMQDWPTMRDSFIECMGRNDWSPALYLYMAGAASVELYRDAVQNGDADAVKAHKEKAQEYFRKAPTVGGKKRIMARQLPLEAFALQRIQGWEVRAKAHGIDLIDATASSPALEMVYMWSGQKRMSVADMEKAVGNISWDRCTASSEVVDEMKKEADELGVWAVGMSALLRGMGQYSEARAMLEEHVLPHDKSVFKGPGKMDYVLPAATYEMGVIAWMECCSPPPKSAEDEDVTEYRRLKLDACQEYLAKAKAWESYTVDARIGLRVQSGLETLNWFRKKMGWH